MVRVWDLVRAPREEEVGFSRGIAGNIFIFRGWGVARRDVESNASEAESSRPFRFVRPVTLAALGTLSFLTR